jgi:hypothetical protein
VGRLIDKANTDLVELGEGDFAEIRRRMSYGESKQLAASFEVKGTAHTATEEYMSKILELNLVALRGPGFGCTLEHDHADLTQKCSTPAIDRTVIDALDPSDSELLLDAINERNRKRGTPGFTPRPSASSDAEAASPQASPNGSSTSRPVASSAGASVS